MHTIRTTSPVEAARFIRNGGLVAFPTETVYGIGANALEAAAVARIFEIKRRPRDNPLIVHVANPDQIGALTIDLSEEAKHLISAFFPGPLTLVLRKDRHVPDVTTSGLATVAVRCPDPPLTREFLAACATPVAAPSANISGRPSPTSWQAVLDDLDGSIDCILEGPRARHGLESTVVDCSGALPLVLRPGAISLESLQEIVPEIRLSDERDVDAPRSPGMRHKHYAPDGFVVIIDDPNEIPPEGGPVGYIGMDLPSKTPRLIHALVAGSYAEYAYSLFDFFRACDARGISTIYAQRVTREGLGLAIMDRIERAAGASDVRRP